MQSDLSDFVYEPWNKFPGDVENGARYQIYRTSAIRRGIVFPVGVRYKPVNLMRSSLKN